MLKGRIKVLPVLFVLLLIPFYVPVAGAESTVKAEISPITLGLGDSVQIANYTIQFYDVSTNWSLVTVRVSYSGGAQLLFLKEGETGYFPSKDAEIFEVAVNAIDRENGRITISIASPLRKVRSGVQMTPGETIVLNRNAMIKLVSSWTNGASIGVKLPPLKDFLRFNLVKGQMRSFDYGLSPGLPYVNYLGVQLVDATPEAAVLNIYLPALDAENLTLKKIPAGNGSQPAPEGPTLYFEAYRGYILFNETATVETEKGTVTLQVSEVSGGAGVITRIGFYIRFSAVNGTVVSRKIALEPGSGPVQVPGIPVMISLYGADLEHRRVDIGIYAPTGSTVSVPPRPANVSVSVNAVPEKLLVGREVAVYIKVANEGPGTAHNLIVAAPIPSGFELVGNETGWSVGDLGPYSEVPAMVYVLRSTVPGEFKISGITATYYSESGDRVQVNSTPVVVRVYGVPGLRVTVLGSNATSGGSSYVHAENGSSVNVFFNLSAVGSSPDFEYITDAVLHLDYPEGIAGPALIDLGTVRAGENVEKSLQVRPLETGRFPIRASITYKDPLGGEHELDLGTVLVVDTVPPKVVVKEKIVHVYPSESELPGFVNESLKNSTNQRGLAKALYGVISPYLPKETNYWKITAVVLAVLTIVLAYLAYGYYREVQTFRRFLLRKRKSRPGGLPKKWKRDELEVLLRELRLELVRESLPGEGGKQQERKV